MSRPGLAELGNASGQLGTAGYLLTELQIALMRVLWDRGESTVQEVQAALDRTLAQSTVATLLRRLEKRGLVTHRVDGRQYVYRAEIDERRARDSMVREFAALSERLFDTDLASLVSHLLSARDVDRGDLERIRVLIEARERALHEGEEEEEEKKT